MPVQYGIQGACTEHIQDDDTYLSSLMDDRVKRKLDMLISAMPS